MHSPILTYKVTGPNPKTELLVCWTRRVRVWVQVPQTFQGPLLGEHACSSPVRTIPSAVLSNMLASGQEHGNLGPGNEIRVLG